MEYHKTSDHIAVLKYFNDILKKDKNNSSFSFIFNLKNDDKIQTIKLVERKSIKYSKIYNKIEINY